MLLYYGCSFRPPNGFRISRRAGCVIELLPQGQQQARVTADMRAPIGAVGCLRLLVRPSIYVSPNRTHH